MNWIALAATVTAETITNMPVEYAQPIPLQLLFSQESSIQSFNVFVLCQHLTKLFLLNQTNNPE